MASILFWLLSIYLSVPPLAENHAPISPAANEVLNQYCFEELDSLLAVAPKPVVVFLTAPWCKYCKNMQQTTLRNGQVVGLLNDDFYFIPFNGEQEDPVSFRGYTFRFEPKGRNSGTHQLARVLGTLEDGSLAYPTLVFLNPQLEIVFQHNAFLSADQLSPLLQRFRSDH